jgi:ATP-binding cassette, subfamily B, bacterial PglK
MLNKFLFSYNYLVKLNPYLDIKYSIILMLLLLGLDMSSVILIYDFINLILGLPSKINLFNAFDISTLNKSLIMVLFFVIKTIISSLVISFFNKTIHSNTSQVRLRLLKKYLIFSEDMSESNKIKNLLYEVSNVTFYLNAFIYVILDILLIISILVLLIWIDYKSMLIIMISFGIFGALNFLIISKKVRSLGKIRFSHMENLSSLIQDSINSIKEIVVYNSEKYFESYVSKNQFYLEKLDIKTGTFKRLPKYYLELLIILDVLAILYLNLNILKTPSDILFSSITAVAFGSFKLLPSISRLMSSIQELSYNHESVLKLSKSIDNDGFKNKKLKLNKKIENLKFKKFNFSYNNNLLFDNADFEIKANQKICVLGESGVGKSTFLELLTGLRKFDKGEIFLNNVAVDTKEFNIVGLVGYVPQEVNIIESSIYENIAFKDEYDKQKIDKLLEKLNLKDFIDNTKNINKFRVSGGQRQRIGIARALYFNYPILIFDEATSSLDEMNKKSIIEIVLNLEKTILFITHDLSESKKFDITKRISGHKII